MISNFIDFFLFYYQNYLRSLKYKNSILAMEWKVASLTLERGIVDYEMFVRILTVHRDQNNSYEITINGFQVGNKTKYTMDPG